MSTAIDGEEPRGLRHAKTLERNGSSAQQAWTLTDLTRSIAALEATCQVESDLAQTLREMAVRDHSEAAARRLRLADEAERGARAAAQTSERLQQHARRRAEYDDEVALRQALEHVARVVAELACAENDIAGMLTDLAERSDPDLTEQRRQLALAASSAGRHARDLAQTLHRLAQTNPVKTELDGTPTARTVTRPAPVESSTPRRLSDLDQRLAELREARQTTVPGDGQDPRAATDTMRRARLARQHWQESIAHLLEARQLAVEALGRAASAHDRAAEANARSARAGIGDVAEHRRMAAHHKAAANADRQQAEKFRDQTHKEAAGPAENLRNVTDASH